MNIELVIFVSIYLYLYCVSLSSFLFFFFFVSLQLRPCRRVFLFVGFFFIRFFLSFVLLFFCFPSFHPSPFFFCRAVLRAVGVVLSAVAVPCHSEEIKPKNNHHRDNNNREEQKEERERERERENKKKRRNGRKLRFFCCIFNNNNNKKMEEKGRKCCEELLENRRVRYALGLRFTDRFCFFFKRTNDYDVAFVFPFFFQMNQMKNPFKIR